MNLRHFFLLGTAGFTLFGCHTETDRTQIKTDKAFEASVETTEFALYDGQVYAAQDWAAMTLPELSSALQTQAVTSVALTQVYLERIEAVDRSGPKLQSVLSLNPDALAQARAADERFQQGQSLGPLDGVPILLKDNIESLDPIATTAGALVLKDNVTRRDSPLVAGFRAQGAVILGKTNLSQWANFRSNDSISGWSALGGQVRNPHMLDRSPCGSSSGSGAAVAASLAAGAVGTETNGSIICPSQVNGIVGFKPSVGVISQDHIIPISSSQDTAGPMSKTVKGAAMMMDAMATDGSGGYADAIDKASLDGVRVGVLRFEQGESITVRSTFNAALAALEDAGAVLVEIEEFSPATENFWGKSLDVLQYEFKATLNDYLEGSPASLPVRSLSELIAFNNENADIELPLFDQSLFDASAEKSDLSDEVYISARDAIQSATRENGIDKLLSDYNVTILVSPSGPQASRVDPVNGDVWPAWAGAGWMAAIAGYPHATVPMGAPKGVPLGFSIMGGSGKDKEVLANAYAFEQVTQKRVSPPYYRDAYDVEALRVALEPNQ